MKVEIKTEVEEHQQQFPDYMNYGLPLLPLPYHLAMIPHFFAPQMLQMGSFYPFAPAFPHFQGILHPMERSYKQNPVKQSRKRKACETISSFHPRPIWTFSCLSVLAIVNSANDTVTTDDIYKFVLRNFLFFESQPYASWTGAIRHNLTDKKHLFERVAISGRIGKWKIVSINAAKTEIEKEVKQNKQQASIGFRNEDDFATLVTSHLINVKKEIED